MSICPECKGFPCAPHCPRRLRVQAAAARSAKRSRPDPIREEMARALEACRSALDGLMGDTDLDGDDSPEMKAMQMASTALSKHRGIDG